MGWKEIVDVEERIGQQLGSYRLVHLLGRGGFADVYLGEHIHLQTLAAVKVLQMRLVGSNLEQFRNEARAIASLIHPYIVRVLDFGVEDGIPFLVMEYASHGTLRQAYPEGTRLPPIQIVPYVNQIADALYYAHSRKLMHRDIKPENFLLGANRKVLLSDFGLVQVVQNTTSQTTKEMAGTVAYMAPEQMNGKPRPASDQYALGVVVYEWLSGHRPFQGSLFEIATQHIMSAPLSLYDRIPGISHEIEKVVFSALAKDPQQRFLNVKAFAMAFEQACWATQGATPSVPTAVLPLNAVLSPFSTVRMSAALPSGVVKEATNQPQGTALLNNAPPMISSPQTNVPAMISMDSRWPAMQIHTPPRTGAAFPFMNSSQNQSFARPITMAAPMQQAMSTLPALGTPSLRRPRKRWWIALTLLLLIVMVSGVIVYAFPKGLGAPSVGHRLSPSRNADHSSVSAPVVPGFATIQILPSSRNIKNTFTIFAVMGVPNSTQSQVQARQVAASQSRSQAATTTGSKQIPATQAAGTLMVMCRSSSSPLTINAGTVFTGADNTSVATDTTVTTSGCHTFITAHAVNYGTSGNIAARDINQPYQGYKVFNEAAFSQGQDAETVAVVGQSDINTTAATLEHALTPAVQQALSAKLNANERFFGNPDCTATVTSDHAAGDEATTVTVTVTMNCTVEAYDHDGAQAMARALLSNQTANNLGSDYGLVGNIATTVGQPTLVNSANGTISLPVTAEGVWAYKWSDTQKQYLAKLVAGKSVQSAKALLQQQPGVGAVNLQLSGGNNATLPSDVSHIVVNVAAMPGF
jgi:serine/threonine protein kinase